MRLAVVVFLLAGAAVAFGTPADAADPANPHDPRAVFAETDTNGDGSVDLTEFHTRIVEVFYRTDANKDGVLVVAEYSLLPLSGDFKKIDGDNGGTLSLDEFTRIRYRQFKAADKNSDGVLSVDEVVEAYEGAAQ